MPKLTSYSIIRILALVLGFLPTLFFLTFLIGEGLAELIDGKLSVLPILALMLFTVSGYILAWKRPRNGGIIMVAGGLIMGIYLIITGGFSEWDIALIYSFPFIVPGILFMALRRFQKSA
jgi:hypothetical protein